MNDEMNEQILNELYLDNEGERIKQDHLYHTTKRF